MDSSAHRAVVSNNDNFQVLILRARHKHTCFIFPLTCFCSECYEHDSSEAVSENVQLPVLDVTALGACHSEPRSRVTVVT
jgi:hypothetical protein